jgi:CRISPR system Cascade subunit CasB
MGIRGGNMGVSFLRFNKGSAELKDFIAWWELLDEKRGDRAELRRCATLTEIVFTPAYHRLRQALCHYGAVHDDGLALVVGLAARVKSNDMNGTIAEQMASGKKDNSARVSGLRFRRLLKIEDKEVLFPAMGRIIALMDRRTNLSSLIQSVYFWNELSRKQLAFDYYSKAPSEK